MIFSLRKIAILIVLITVTETKVCKNSGVLVSIKGVDYCVCHKNYFGDECEIYLNDMSTEDKRKFGCALRPCWIGSTCEDLTHLNGTFRCHCSANTYGEFCEKSTTERNDPCRTNPCYNQGQCENLDDISYRCLCNSSFGGSSCKQNTLSGCNAGSTRCQRDSTCIPINQNDYKCNCLDWTIGKDCEFVFNPCQYVNCPNNGMCLKRRTLGYECKCGEGFTGYFCTQRLNDTCLKNSCVYGECLMEPLTGEWYCSCKSSGFVGEYCEIEKCDPKCVNGLCKRNDIGVYACECASGYAGASCSDLACFPGDMLVETENNTTLKISELKYGDIIKTYDSNTKAIKFTKFITYLHKDENIHTKYILVKTNRNERLKISPKHLIAIKINSTKEIFKFADNLLIGDNLIDSKGLTVQITHIETIYENGAYAPLTEDGSLYVNELLVSCYANIKSHQIAHLAMSPIIFISKYSQSILNLFNQKNVFWYAQFLYDMVMISPTQISSFLF